MLASWLLTGAPAAVTNGPGASHAANAAGSIPNGTSEGMDVDAAPASAHTDGAEELRARMEGFLQSMVAGMEVRIAFAPEEAFEVSQSALVRQVC